MKYILKTLSLILILLVLSCGGKDENKEKQSIKLGSNTTETKKIPEPKVAAEMIDMNNKGIGPVTSVTLSKTIDEALAAKGADVFKAKCTACHKPTKKFIGPAPLGVLERRSPEWIMNMILNPEEMTQKDPIARQLLIANNGSPMANQSLTQDEARAILEYFRTIKAE